MGVNRRRRTRALSTAGLVAVLVGVAIAYGQSAVAGASPRLEPYGLTAVQTTRLTREAERYGRLAQRLISSRSARLRKAHRVVHAGDAPDPGALAAIKAVGLRLAALNGSTNPTGGLVYSSGHVLAQTVLTGDTVTDDRAVFSVVLHGHFVAYEVRGPHGEVPAGSILAITFDANTLEVTDWSLQSMVRGDINALGSGTPLN